MMIPFKNNRTNSETGSSIYSWLFLSFYSEYVIGFGIFILAAILNVIKFLLPKPPKNLTGNVILIAGASSTLGEFLAEEFARNGCSVICVDNDLRSMEEMTARLRSRRVKGIGPDYRKHESENGRLSTIVAYKCDLKDRRAIREIAWKVEDEVGGIDVLVNCVDQTDSNIYDIATTFLMSHYLTMMTFLPFLLQSDNACIVEVLPVVTAENICLSSRTALVNLMERLSGELNNICGCLTFLSITRIAKHQSLIRQTEQQLALDVVQAVKGNHYGANWLSKILYRVGYMIYNAITTFTQWLHTEECDYSL